MNHMRSSIIIDKYRLLILTKFNETPVDGGFGTNDFYKGTNKSLHFKQRVTAFHQ